MNRVCINDKCNKEFDSTHGGQIYCCKECREDFNGRRYYKNNKQKRKNYLREYNRNHKQKCRDSTSAYRNKIQNKLLEMYGGKCNNCGEKNPIFLTLDHVKNDGFKSGRSRFRDRVNAVKEYNPDLYQILCYNCNCSKARNGGALIPHCSLSMLSDSYALDLNNIGEDYNRGDQWLLQ